MLASAVGWQPRVPIHGRDGIRRRAAGITAASSPGRDNSAYHRMSTARWRCSAAAEARDSGHLTARSSASSGWSSVQGATIILYSPSCRAPLSLYLEGRQLVSEIYSQLVCGAVQLCGWLLRVHHGPRIDAIFPVKSEKMPTREKSRRRLHTRPVSLYCNRSAIAGIIPKRSIIFSQ